MQNYYDSTYGGQSVNTPQASDYETYKAINNGEVVISFHGVYLLYKIDSKSLCI